MLIRNFAAAVIFSLAAGVSQAETWSAPVGMGSQAARDAHQDPFKSAVEQLLGPVVW